MEGDIKVENQKVAFSERGNNERTEALLGPHVDPPPRAFPMD